VLEKRSERFNSEALALKHWRNRDSKFGLFAGGIEADAYVADERPAPLFYDTYLAPTWASVECSHRLPFDERTDFIPRLRVETLKSANFGIGAISVHDFGIAWLEATKQKIRSFDD
jgi:hypothetical protein